MKKEGWWYKKGFHDYRDFLACGFMVSGFFIIPWLGIGLSVLLEEGRLYGFLIWPIVFVLVSMLAKGMADNMCR